MKKIIVLLLAVFIVSFSAFAQNTNVTKAITRAYINKYANIAIEEMYRTGVPASITLAQAIIESKSGTSELARMSNNHFGIKCHQDWKGKTVFYDDDKRQECFRSYPRPEDSFVDHSDFLRYRDRYRFLFSYPVTDYRAWAYGLKKAGYATDPNYANKLIQKIQDYDLSRFDKYTYKNEKLPSTPQELEKSTALSNVANESYLVNLNRIRLSSNGVPYLIALKGEHLDDIASDYHLFNSEIRRFNDLSANDVIKAGDIVYLQDKKDRAAKGLSMYIIEHDGQSLWQIAQRFGIKLSSLMKMNGFKADHKTKEGDTIILRPNAR